jgi:amino acid adenylation domain-containing protein
VVEELQPEREESRSPLFQVMFDVGVGRPGLMTAGGVGWEARRVENATAKYDLTLSLAEHEGGWEGEAEYDAELFDREWIGRFCSHYVRLLGAAAESPSRPAASLRMLSDEERRKFLAGRNAVGRTFARDECLHQLFEAQVARTPDSVALYFGKEQLTYRELNARANQLARHLRAAGVGAGTLVGVCVERSVELVVALLGVLKAGGGYVPLDPNYPARRLAFMLEDSGVRAVLTQQGVGHVLPENRAEFVYLDRDWEEIRKQPEDDLAVETSPNSLAYVIYTSGSTGDPKGAMVTHRNVVRLFDATQAEFGFDGRDVWTMFHSYAFDFSVWEMWGALLYGGSLVVVPYWVSRSPEAFWEVIKERGVTVLNQTPSAFYALAGVAEKDASACHLRLVIFGGEALDYGGLAPWVKRFGADSPALVNMYGITETTVHVTRRRVSAAEVEGGAKSLIGEAIDDLRLYILDEALEPVPWGVAGELYVGGAGLARGYLGRPALTAERFISDPFSREAGGRLYKTGDVARHLLDGELEYLGRADSQVKIRGYRIELGEVEAALRAQAGVRQAAVEARGEGAGRRLVAYVVAEEGVTAGELLAGLRERMPEYMVPSAVVTLDSLPLTPSRKVDRRALPEPEWGAGQAAEAGAGWVAPRTPVEEAVASVWAEVLGAERVGAHSDFFKLGGHSLLAAQAVARLRDEFGVELPLRSLFESPTVAGVADFITRSRTEAAPSPDGIRAIHPDGPGDVLSRLEELTDEELDRMYQSALAEAGESE